MAQDLAFAAPRTEEMTRTGIGVGVGAATGVVQGVVAKFAPQFGKIAPFLTWGSLIATPLVGVAGALFTRGMISDAFMGVAAGSSGVLGYSIPGLLEVGLAQKAPGQLTEAQRAALAAGNKVKQLPPGAAFAPQRQQALAKSSLEI
ncbi:unnamed protein product [marine sediment metagenome]|uniref:Uncharacterized protein n=1 Tax=marine sediment metagenome TaxID=412755 RepID=X1RR87_9ZZZZ